MRYGASETSYHSYPPAVLARIVISHDMDSRGGRSKISSGIIDRMRKSLGLCIAAGYITMEDILIAIAPARNKNGQLI